MSHRPEPLDAVATLPESHAGVHREAAVRGSGDEFDLVAGLEELTHGLGPTAHAAGLELICQIAPELAGAFVGDTASLFRAITLLVEKAVRVTEHGEVAVVVTSEVEATPSPFADDWKPNGHTSLASARGSTSVLFEVIATDRNPSAPDRLEREAPAQNLIESLGGILAVRRSSRQGRVWSFRISLLSARGRDEMRRQVPALVHGKTLLVADDNATTRSVLEELLSGWGAHVHVEDHGEAVVASLRRSVATLHPFDAILLDARMPRLSGFEVADFLAKNPMPCGPLILMMPVPCRKGDIAYCQRLGVAARVDKPVRRTELLHVLETVLSQAPGSAPAEARSPSSVLHEKGAAAASIPSL